MIISASRRTDIPAFYTDWFFHRIRAGFVYVRNPMNPCRISKINLSPEAVDGFVFWTKNPAPFLSRLKELEVYPYYFQFTLTPYDRDIECHLPPKTQLTDTFRQLSEQIGPERIIWRYDPLLLSDTITPEYHWQHFGEIAARLSGYTHQCVISFLDNYTKLNVRLKSQYIRTLSQEEIYTTVRQLSEIAQYYRIRLQTCAEPYDLSEFGIERGHCIDPSLFYYHSNCQLPFIKDKNQRPECGCAQSTDIGEYNTCRHQCVYCYANSSPASVQKKAERHFPGSPLLTGEVSEKDIIGERSNLRPCSRKHL